MAKYRCDECDELQPITPTGEKQGAVGSSEWWTIASHPNKKTGQRCLGSGRKV